MKDAGLLNACRQMGGGSKGWTSLEISEGNQATRVSPPKAVAASGWKTQAVLGWSQLRAALPDLHDLLTFN